MPQKGNALKLSISDWPGRAERIEESGRQALFNRKLPKFHVWGPTFHSRQTGSKVSCVAVIPIDNTPGGGLPIVTMQFSGTLSNH